MISKKLLRGKGMRAARSSLSALAATAHGRASVPRGPAVRRVRWLATPAHASAGAATTPPPHRRTKLALHLGGAQQAWPPPPPPPAAGRRGRGARGRPRSSHLRRDARMTTTTSAAWPPNLPPTSASAWPCLLRASHTHDSCTTRTANARCGHAAPAANPCFAETITAGLQPVLSLTEGFKLEADGAFNHLELSIIITVFYTQ